jgi:hypothetical protein
VERVEMKNRFAFVYMPSKREAEAAIRGLNRAFGGESATRLRVFLPAAPVILFQFGCGFRFGRI